ncbi:glycosyltransferase family 2 protein [Zavarzinia sp. CC-PAN008]|uniref:glycosyltransferase family 2 protein n=1 Tax=Zavarzinia sp. CC-PAN008 TaxID=3243332 RepID=UPI003F74629B
MDLCVILTPGVDLTGVARAADSLKAMADVPQHEMLWLLAAGQGAAVPSPALGAEEEAVGLVGLPAGGDLSLGLAEAARRTAAPWLLVAAAPAALDLLPRLWAPTRQADPPSLVLAPLPGGGEAILIAREALLDLPYFVGMHRHLPRLVARIGRRTLVVDGARSALATGPKPGLVDGFGLDWLERRSSQPHLAREVAEPQAAPVALSVVIPVLNEQENVGPLLAEAVAALDGLVDFEVIYVDDGSTDATPERLLILLSEEPRLRVIRHSRRYGQSAAVHTGVRAARGAWIATLDGDRQNDPADLPRLVRLAAGDAPPGLLAGERVNRRDTIVKRVSSRLANFVRRAMLNDGTRDTGCGLKVFRRDLFLELPYFDHMHRFLPALAQRAGGTVRPVPVGHRHRTAGRSKYGTLDRLIVSLSDLLGVAWLIRRAGPAALLARAPEPLPLLQPLADHVAPPRGAGAGLVATRDER